MLALVAKVIVLWSVGCGLIIGDDGGCGVMTTQFLNMKKFRLPLLDVRGAVTVRLPPSVVTVIGVLFVPPCSGVVPDHTMGTTIGCPGGPDRSEALMKMV